MILRNVFKAKGLKVVGMKVMKISDNAHQLTQWGMINAFLVEEDDGFTLIDTCMGQAEAIVEAAADLRHPIVRIVLTHAHQDHVGSLDALVKMLPAALVMVGHRELRLLRGDLTLEAIEARFPLRGSYVESHAKVSRELDEGDKVGSLRVIASSGHTPGHIALLDEREGTLFAGDAWSTLGGVIPGGAMNWKFPLPAMATWNRKVALETSRKLCGLEPERLAVGHGRTVEVATAAMKKALAQV
jgi:glyoxylase-like metal-dependent hydrolase (beta-lactamase superfamily II)